MYFQCIGAGHCVLKYFQYILTSMGTYTLEKPRHTVYDKRKTTIHWKDVGI